ncbi:putative HTH-type transcriptional regulator YtcD [Paenibacillus sp. P1XP2]|nr:putative HTH-type transcriptional regulator YtcD [Paenibacillus sp. P1XP2]
MISRIVYNEVPPKVEYELTEYGWTLKDILYMMCRWGDTHIEQKYDGNAVVLQNRELEASR